jgi:glycosyltransferase involved in cell wall biosynthesis
VTDILCFSSSDWRGKWGSRQQVMLRMAQRGYRILFVERQVGLEHLWRYPEILRRKIARWRQGIQDVVENIWIVSLPPLLPGRYYSNRVARLDQRWIVGFTRPYIATLGIEDPILWTYRPEHGGLIGAFDECLSVYHCIDEFTAGTTGRKRQMIAWLEMETLRKADVVLANSLLTFERKRAYNPHTYRIPSGVDVSSFSRVLDPGLGEHPDIQGIPHPIAGYVGNLNRKLDIPLLVEVVDRLADWQFVFVGQVDWHTKGIQGLKKRANLHFLGSYPFEVVPSLVKRMDVCLLPYADDEYARFRSPLKLYEYLAAGKPVVSTDHPEVREFLPWVELASGVEDYAGAIRRASTEEKAGQQATRSAQVRNHSWDQRVDEIEEILGSQLEAKAATRG